ncbi:DDE_3 domain-containing protein [Trichonephila clavipes]|nr:DDE_3 domain-containing protein [Trichonephila clavipes]
MVWGAVAYDSRSTLIVMRETFTDQRYVDDILRPYVGPFLNGLPGAIFHQDNARPHTARVAQDFLRHFQTLPWPARSPDLSPVDNVRKLDQVHEPKSPQEIVHQKRTGIDVLPIKSCTKQKMIWSCLYQIEFSTILVNFLA